MGLNPQKNLPLVNIKNVAILLKIILFSISIAFIDASIFVIMFYLLNIQKVIKWSNSDIEYYLSLPLLKKTGMKKSVKIAVISVFVLIIIFFSCRNFVLKKIVDSVSEKVQQKYQLTVSFEKVRFTGITGVMLRGTSVSYNDTVKVVHFDTLKLYPAFFPLFTGHVRLRAIKASGGDIVIDSVLLSRFKVKRDTTTSLTSAVDYSQTLYHYWHLLLGGIPGRMDLSRIALTYRHDTLSARLFCNRFDLRRKNFVGELGWINEDTSQLLNVKGTLSKDDGLDVCVAKVDKRSLKVPYLTERWKAIVGFDTLNFGLSFKKVNAHLVQGQGIISAAGFTFQHPRIGPDTVFLASGGANIKFFVGSRYIEIDSSSVCRMNQFSFSPYFRYEKLASKRIELGIVRQEFEADAFFRSLPKGLFSNFEGIKTSGRLAYRLKAKLDFSQPDNVVFESKLENLGFKIEKYGVTDFRMMNGAFIHEVYENDRFVKSILVSPDNPDFVALDDISPYFKYSVLTSEDGDFFYHHGFNADAFRESIATNFKEKRFARGGSTISMQLVKNVFLSRKKTVSRKVEEALIVWMIENTHLVSKQRMFEVYLNIMELGPGVYGIKPAAYFYFKKSPSALNLQESIFLSSIIPRPKAFRYSFVSNGVLRDYLANYYRLVEGIMLRRNQILPSDTVNLRPYVKLTGEAKKYLATPDSTKTDSAYYKEEELIPFLN
jgi:hypothetical protein